MQHLVNIDSELVRSEVVIPTVERIIEELIYNSLDAKANYIRIKWMLEQTDSFPQGFTVSDNGLGILCYPRTKIGARFYTTKSTNGETYGWKGEFLSSLRAIADVCIYTRKSYEEKWQVLNITEGKTYEIPQNDPHIQWPFPSATIISVYNIFKNIPVRRLQFQNDRNDIWSRIKQMGINAVFGHQNVELYMYCAKKDGVSQRLEIFPNSYMQRFIDAFPSPNYTENDTLLHMNEQAKGYHIEGFISSVYLRSDISRDSNINLWINYRHFTNENIANHITRLYKRCYLCLENNNHRLAEKRYPIVYLVISCSADLLQRVLWNPNELTLKEEEKLTSIIKYKIAKILSDSELWLGEILMPELKSFRKMTKYKHKKSEEREEKRAVGFYNKQPLEVNRKGGEIPMEIGRRTPSKGSGGGRKERYVPSPSTPEWARTLIQEVEREEEERRVIQASNEELQFPADIPKSTTNTITTKDHYDKEYKITYIPYFSEPPITRDMLKNMQILTQLDKKFILGKTENILLCIDQHAAHERVCYEYFIDLLLSHLNHQTQPKTKEFKLKFNPEISQTTKRRLSLSLSTVPKEEILSPMVLTPSQKLEVGEEAYKIITNTKQFLEEWGWSFRTWAHKKTYWEIVISTIPLIFSKPINPIQDFIQFAIEINKYLLNSSVTPHTIYEYSLYTMPSIIINTLKERGCHAAIKFGEDLYKEEMNMLVEMLINCRNPFNCSHGRPSIRILSTIGNTERKMNNSSNSMYISKLLQNQLE